MMILTLTLNPAIDHVLLVEKFELARTIRASVETRTPSGKGIGSSLVLQELGAETLALGLKAGHAGVMLASMLDDIGVKHHLLDVSGETRIATIIVDQQTGQQSTISAVSLAASQRHLSEMLDLLTENAHQAWGLICAGSLPPGLPDDSYATIIQRSRQLGMYTLLDTSGAALTKGIVGLPHILKINDSELNALQPGITISVASPEMIRQSLTRLRQYIGIWASDAIIVTLGSRGGLAVTLDGSYFAQPLKLVVESTAGAGDALNAGLMMALSQGESWKQALVWGTAAASSVVTNAGTAICQRHQVEAFSPQVVIEDIPFFS